eukprot:scpid32513/ scgid9573/ 
MACQLGRSHPVCDGSLLTLLEQFNVILGYQSRAAAQRTHIPARLVGYNNFMEDIVRVKRELMDIFRQARIQCSCSPARAVSSRRCGWRSSRMRCTIDVLFF